MSTSSKPIRIGVSACFFHADPERPIFKGKTLLYLEQSMSHWVMAHGALPLMLPDATAGFRPQHLTDVVDGLLLQGGSDVCPRSYGEEPLRPEWNGDLIRDRYEIELLRAFMQADKPVLGVCRGAQLINVALGGTLYQDINEQQPETLVHRDWNVYDTLKHEVDLVPGTGLHALYAREGGTINSIHHQAIKDVAPGLVVEARSRPDDIVEAIRYQAAGANVNTDAKNPYVFAVQWHPEFQPANDSERLPREPIFEDFLAAIRDRI